MHKIKSFFIDSPNIGLDKSFVKSIKSKIDYGGMKCDEELSNFIKKMQKNKMTIPQMKAKD